MTRVARGRIRLASTGPTINGGRNDTIDPSHSTISGTLPTVTNDETTRDHRWGVYVEHVERVPSYTGLELAEMSTDHPSWVIAPYIVAGGITELSGDVKLAGKTTLLAHMSDAVVHGSPFLGRAVNQGPVVYVTEQSTETFRQSIRGTRLLSSADIHIIFLSDLRVEKLTWDEMVYRADLEAGRCGARLMIFDTFFQIAGVKDEHDASEAIRVMEPLQIVAGRGKVGVTIARHDRKAGGDVAKSSRGSSAYAGAADIVMQLKRPAGSTQTNKREIAAVGRYDETPGFMGIELTETGYIVTSQTVSAGDRPRDVVLFHMGIEPMTPDEIMTASGVPIRTVQRALYSATEENRIDRSGRGVAGDPYRYALKAHVSPRGCGQHDTNGNGHQSTMPLV